MNKLNLAALVIGVGTGELYIGCLSKKSARKYEFCYKVSRKV